MRNPTVGALALVFVLALGLLAGCATGPLPTGPIVRLPPAGGSSGSDGPSAGRSTSRIMAVESEPADAIIVVDGRPVGRAPLRIAVPTNSRGFFLGYVEVRARFLGRADGPDGKTTVLSFSPLEKVPSKLTFTPSGSHQTL